MKFIIILLIFSTINFIDCDKYVRFKRICPKDVFTFFWRHVHGYYEFPTDLTIRPNSPRFKQINNFVNDLKPKLKNGYLQPVVCSDSELKSEFLNLRFKERQGTILSLCQDFRTEFYYKPLINLTRFDVKLDSQVENENGIFIDYKLFVPGYDHDYDWNDHSNCTEVKDLPPFYQRGNYPPPELVKNHKLFYETLNLHRIHINHNIDRAPFENCQ